MDSGTALLTVEQMYRADKAAITGGVPGVELMANAGAAVAREIRARWASRPVAVLCGPGNNGGDGFVVARLLKEAGWPVTVHLLGERSGLKGDAARHAGLWSGPVSPLAPDSVAGVALVVDALFGAGLDRQLDGVALAVIEAVRDSGLPCVAIDLPSGVHGDTGAVLGSVARADLTVTFFRRKPGHLLMPGRNLAGEVAVADIGIPESVLAEISPSAFANEPGLWLKSFPWPGPADHKYSRGHALIAGGTRMTGAARLAARAAMRAGAGMVTVAGHPEVLPIYAADMAGLLTEPVTTAPEFQALLADPRRNAVLVGPGSGVDRRTRDMVLGALDSGRAVVLDADAITVFADEAGTLLRATDGRPCLLTPHEGEFARIFEDGGDKLSRTRAAAAACGATVLLKGFDTVIAAPDGRAAINYNAPAELSTAGAGDVLAGLALGLMAQGMAPFTAACAAAWIHGEAASSFGPGLIAEDIPSLVPPVLKMLKALQNY